MKAKQTLIAILAISATTAMASDQKDFVGMSVGTGISAEYGRDIGNDLTLRATTNHLRWSRDFLGQTRHSMAKPSWKVMESIWIGILLLSLSTI